MRRLIPALFIVLALSPCANASEKLKYSPAAHKAEEIAYASNLVRAEIFTHSNRYYQQGKIKPRREARNFMIKTAAKGHTLKVRNPLNCFNSLAPDYCWYSGPAEIDSAQPAVDLESAYFENSAPANEELCSTANQPCENPYDREGIYTNVTAGEYPWQPKKAVNTKSQVKLDFFSISVIF